MYPRFAQPKTAFGVQYNPKSAAGAIEGSSKCLVIFLPYFEDCLVLVIFINLRMIAFFVIRRTDPLWFSLVKFACKDAHLFSFYFLRRFSQFSFPSSWGDTCHRCSLSPFQRVARLSTLFIASVMHSIEKSLKLILRLSFAVWNSYTNGP
jgi:hypothetical protein